MLKNLKALTQPNGFGSNTRIYISKNQIFLVESDSSTNILNSWLTDKGRQFFDSIFGLLNSNKNNFTCTNLRTPYV
jgi:hypothetical protein